MKKFYKLYKLFKLILYITFLIIFFPKINQLSNLYENYINKQENLDLKTFLDLKYFNHNNKILISKEKQDILKMINKDAKKNISSIKNIFFFVKCNFGNCLGYLNKILFYCEIIRCESMTLDKNSFWFIKREIRLKNYNFTIKVGDKNNLNNSFHSLFYRADILFYTFFNIKPEIRIHLVRDEILNNIPKITCLLNDLYIYIRGGDAFSLTPHHSYAQPPLCFYKKVLKNFQFRNIYIISSDKNNPVIDKIINLSTNIIYNKNTLKLDISLLINAYNIIGAMSSFSTSIIQLNNKLKILFDYNIYRTKQKIRLYHYDLYNYPNRKFIIFRMEPSSNYKIFMYKWKNKKNQRKLMLKEKCKLNFKIRI